MRPSRQLPDPAAVAWRLRTLRIHAQGCIKPVPDPLTRSRSRLTTRHAASSLPRPRPKPTPNQNRHPDERDGRDEYPDDHH
jgi:hypothetical protein